MSLQWNIIATVLYVEVGLCVLLLLPFISATRWRSVFRSRLFTAVAVYSKMFSFLLLILLVILFADGVRDIRQYWNICAKEDMKLNPGSDAYLHKKKFRAERNCYISAFTLFLFFVLRRLVGLLTRQAALQADYEAAQKQAASATSAAKRFMEIQDNKDNEVGERKVAKELEIIEKEKSAIKAELKNAELDREAIKHQAESLTREYDRLLKEHSSLQEKLKQAGHAVGTKKSE